MVFTPVKHVWKDIVVLPSKYSELLQGYQKRLGLERNDCLLEILLAFNAFEGSFHFFSHVSVLTAGVIQSQINQFTSLMKVISVEYECDYRYRGSCYYDT